jgi:hypothetical protein
MLLGLVASYGVVLSDESRRTAALRRMASEADLLHPGPRHAMRLGSFTAIAYRGRDQTGAPATIESDALAGIVLGQLDHPDLATQNTNVFELLDHSLRTQRLPEFLAQCIGDFGLVLVDRRTDELVLATDCLAARPLFYAVTPDGAVFGSSVWPIFQSGEVTGALDPDALASWLHLNYPQGTSTLFRAIQKVPGGTLLRIVKGHATATTYVRLRPYSVPSTGADLVDEIDAVVSRTCKALTKGRQSVGVFLSGGFDSRYVACLLKRQGLDCVAYTVPYESGDAELAPAVAKRLDIPLRSVPVVGSLDDAYGDPLRWSPAGFPIGKFVTRLLVEQYRQLPPTATGFLGDTLIRPWDPVGFSPAIFDLAPRVGSLAEAIVEHQTLIDPGAAFLPSVAQRLRRRSIAQVEAFLQATDGPDQCKLALWLLYNRKANWLANNHLQDADRIDTFHPFYSRELIELRLSREPSLLTLDLYRRLFRERYPEVAAIPHSGEVAKKFNAVLRWSWFQWRAVPRVAVDVATKPWARATISRDRVLPRMAVHLAGTGRWAYVFRYLHPIAALMRRLESNGLEVDWKEL